MPDSFTLFVYGSLMQGEPNHALLAQGEYLGPARTEPCYRLVEFGQYPALLPNGDTSVVGELYQVTADTLARADILEDHPHVYERTPIRLADGRSAWAYLLRARVPGPLPPVRSGDWRAHRHLGKYRA